MTLLHLIALANKQLDSLDMRYKLKLVDKKVGNDKIVKEIIVVDTFQGDAERSINTLSGGETFLVSLAMALALSDMASKNVKIESLFIDEGFGSLDPESLDLAIRTLIDLQASGRMIGIISHVSELKEQMALRLDVLSGRDGSHIATVAV